MPTPQLPRAVLVVAALSVVGWGLLVLGAGQGWLGESTGRGGGFCEAGGPGLLRQPVNTLSNLGFTVAGLGIAWRRDRTPGAPAALTAYAVVVALLGPASAAMHATETALGGRLDLFSMYLLASFTAAYAVVRSGWLEERRGALLLGGLLLLCEVVGSLPVSVPVLMHPGNVVFAVLLMLTVGLEGRLVHLGRAPAGWGLASVGTLLLAFAVWSQAKDGSALCAPGSVLQGHGVWHLLDALAAWFLARHYLARHHLARHHLASGPRSS